MTVRRFRKQLVAGVGVLSLALAAVPDEDVIARLVKKTLFIGVFAYIINNWTNLARIVFESFAGLGLKASGTGLSEAEFLRPGRVAQVGLDAGKPILESISGLMGFVSFFENFIQIAVLLFAWAIVILAFFILAIQLFVSLIEFKLTTLAGFVLIPFGLFNKTAFAAERVLGNVMSAGSSATPRAGRARPSASTSWSNRRAPIFSPISSSTPTGAPTTSKCARPSGPTWPRFRGPTPPINSSPCVGKPPRRRRCSLWRAGSMSTRSAS